MARSIGKVNLRKLKGLVQNAIKECSTPYNGTDYQKVRELVSDRVPDEWFDIWEGAYNEISNSIEDFIMEAVYR